MPHRLYIRTLVDAQPVGIDRGRDSGLSITGWKAEVKADNNYDHIFFLSLFPFFS